MRFNQARALLSLISYKTWRLKKALAHGHPRFSFTIVSHHEGAATSKLNLGLTWKSKFNMTPAKVNLKRKIKPDRKGQEIFVSSSVYENLMQYFNLKICYYLSDSGGIKHQVLLIRFNSCY